MALDQQSLATAITAAMKKQFPPPPEEFPPEAAAFAADLAAAIAAFVRAGEVRGVQVGSDGLTLAQTGSVTVQ
jgi:hypothetical protein